MAVQRLEGLASAYAVGDNVGDFLRGAADAAGNAACGMYKDYPGAFAPATVFDVPTPLSEASRGLMDSLCSGRVELPPPPTVPFKGGQCEKILYRVEFRYTRTNPDGSTSAAGGSAITIYGSLKGLSTEPGVGAGTTNWYFTGKKFDGTVDRRTVGANFPNNLNVTVFSVARADARPDTCGDPKPGYPPQVVPPSRSSGTTSITNNTGGNITIPFAYVPITPTLEFSPQVRVDLGGINVRFDLGGVDVQFPDVAPAPPGLPDFPDGGGSKSPGGGGGSPPTPPAKPTPGDPNFPPDEGQPKPGEDEDAPGIKYLEVVVTKLPDKIHFGEGGANVIFAGWIAFRAKSGGYYPRQQINFAQSVFEAPEGADGYTYTFTNGAEGRVREYVVPAN